MSPSRSNRLLVTTVIVVAAIAPPRVRAQVSAPVRALADTVVAISAPRNPLPSEAASAGISRFSFIVYGDTRGRRDGVDPQYEHSMIVDAMLRTIAERERGSDPVRLVLQSGDAVVNGRDPRQWNASFTGLINRLTTQGGVPYFLPTAALRAIWMPLFRRHRVRLLVTGHEHPFEHWVERYRDANGTIRRMDQLVTGGGGAPLYQYRGEPDLWSYVAASGADSVRLDHLVRPGLERGDNPYHFVVVHVDGDRLSVEVQSVDWGIGYAPYRSNRAVLRDSVP